MPERRLIDATELFAAMPDDVLEQLREHAVVRQYERNEVLFHQGDASHDLFIVQTGRIAIAAQAGDGRESVISVLGPGALFGEISMFDGGVRSANARALTESSVIAVEYDHVRDLLQARPEVLWVVVRILSPRLRATDEALADAMFLDVTGRTAKRLLELAGDQDEFRMPLTQEELAAMVGASRERVNKAIALFSSAGSRSRPQPLPHPRPRGARRPSDALAIKRPSRRQRRGSGSTPRNLSARFHTSAASSARWAGRSGSCTKPCSAPSTTTISQSGRPLHAARNASMSAAGVHGSTDPKIAKRRAHVGGRVERLAQLAPRHFSGRRIIP